MAAFKRLKGTDGGLLSGRLDGTGSSRQSGLLRKTQNRGKRETKKGWREKKRAKQRNRRKKLDGKRYGGSGKRTD